jgi:hypothetical protein
MIPLNGEDKGGLEDVDGFGEVEKDILNVIYCMLNFLISLRIM